MFALFRRRKSPAPTRSQPSAATRWRPSFESLEDRTTPTVSTIASSANLGPMLLGQSLWFASAAQVSGVPASGATVEVTDQTISFTAGGVAKQVHVPDSTITFSPGASTASVSTVGGEWAVTSPTALNGNVFLAGEQYKSTSLLSLSVRNVSWTANFKSDTPGLTVTWQWSAGVYTLFGRTDAAVLGVKASDAPTAAHPNWDRAGTPEKYKLLALGGSTSTATASVSPESPQQLLATLSGAVRDDQWSPQSGVRLMLTGTNDLGESVSLEAWTDENGTYRFSDLRAGTYTITMVPPPAPEGYSYEGTSASIGSVGEAEGSGTANGTMIEGIQLGGGDDGVEYNFFNTYQSFG